VRELHEDQEALQLHSRAIRIRQKTLGVWNATVAETLFNVSVDQRWIIKYDHLNCDGIIEKLTFLQLLRF